MIGDSLTAQGNWKSYCGISANYGVNSDTTRGVLSRLSAIESRHYRVAVVLIGVNDIAIGIPTIETVSNTQTIVDRLRASGAKVVLLSLLPVTSRYPRPGFNAKIDTLNMAMTVVAGAARVKLSIPPHLYRDDGIHLQPAAYGHWWSAISDHANCQGDT